MEQAIDRVCLVVLACEPANHQATVDRLSAALDIRDWDGPADLPYFGIRNAVSHPSGLEVIAPWTTAPPSAHTCASTARESSPSSSACSTCRPPCTPSVSDLAHPSAEVCS
jgi:hypothetical protein